jgi:hypothetical protein
MKKTYIDFNAFVEKSTGNLGVWKKNSPKNTSLPKQKHKIDISVQKSSKSYFGNNILSQQNNFKKVHFKKTDM